LAYLPLDPRFAGSNPTKDNGFLRAIKIHSIPFFRGEVKPSAHVVRLYGMLKNPSKCEQKIQHFVRSNSSFHLIVPPALLLDDSAGRISRQLW
jgi:hypothetical protein